MMWTNRHWSNVGQLSLAMIPSSYHVRPVLHAGIYASCNEVCVKYVQEFDFMDGEVLKIKNQFKQAGISLRTLLFCAFFFLSLSG
ncbi:hypothetical protein M514_09098 [Trichuris suis]|uniref:Uncharacterized protein n=1 Tax=Trichuris suis TaxID=68888 RepID=A0A085LYF9_9BILA|nr:hypothetical protein M513_09098 [Trichuris suis]KFD64741.1 hypothetical protein M514_09098 [Trichuris suis]